MEIFPSTIIISNNAQNTLQKIGDLVSLLNQDLNPNNPDLYLINDNISWSIESVREIKNFLAKKPYNHQNKLVIVFDAHNFKTEAQNALLKTLEEPGENNYLIITTSQVSNLLPTIISRCYVIKLNPKKKRI